MLNKTCRTLIEKSKPLGWMLEPDAKQLMRSIGFDTPEHTLTRSVKTAEQFLKNIKSPVVIKAVSPEILHKTEHNAVVTGITDSSHLKTQMARMLALDGCENVLVEQMIAGTELIIGAKNDFQFGPVVVFGIGGTSVEIYNDTAIRMAPVTQEHVASMINSLKARQILYGYRGQPGVPLGELTRMIIDFSTLIMEMQDDIDSIDLNPVICTRDACIIADARIMLRPSVNEQLKMNNA